MRKRVRHYAPAHSTIALKFQAAGANVVLAVGDGASVGPRHSKAIKAPTCRG